MPTSTATTLKAEASIGYQSNSHYHLEKSWWLCSNKKSNEH